MGRTCRGAAIAVEQRPWICLAEGMKPGLAIPFKTLRLAVAIRVVLLSVCAWAAEPGWFPFAPASDPFDARSVVDLRQLNEPVAGAGGWIQSKGGDFVQPSDGRIVRFWGVNGPPHELRSPTQLAHSARVLAKYGVNLVRAHGAVFTKEGSPDTARISQLQAIVEACKKEGIYTHLSIYFPLWMTPGPEVPWLKGYDGHKHPFSTLLFNPEFQQRYRAWWEALLLTPGASGRGLVDEPAVMGVELQNEDSFFFWTFSEQNVPSAQLELLEARFGSWAARRHGSVAAALAKWGGKGLSRDRVEEGRLGFRPLWNLAHERTLRDQETAEFLLEVQSSFYKETVAFLRKLGFKGLVTASNWTTADNAVLGPLEKLSYTAGDFVDRHGYFDSGAKGEASEWSIRAGHTYVNRSALRFDGASEAGKRLFNHPVMDQQYDDLPSMLSETTWNRPNRHRSEAPLFLAAYAALQGTDGIVHFAYDTDQWKVKPGYFMQPWTLMAPSQVAQFPAAALIYRLGLIHPGELLAEVRLARKDLLALKGTPLPQDASFDELRLKDIPPEAAALKPGQVIDPLIHFAGRTHVRFVDGEASGVVAKPLGGMIRHEARTVESAGGELFLDYGKGLLSLRAPCVQGASGALALGGAIQLPDLVIQSPLDLAHIVVVALDAKPISTSKRLLLQVMTEERPTGWSEERLEGGRYRISSLGGDPWEVREIRGTVEFKRSDAGSMRVIPLDLLGVPREPLAGGAGKIDLLPSTVYYLIEG